MADKMEENRDMENIQSDSLDSQRGISPFVIKVMVSAYLLWVIQEIIFGIIRGETEGRMAVLLGIVSAALLLATIGLFFTEMKEFIKKRKDKDIGA